MTIIDGKKIAAEIRARVKNEIIALGRSPGLGVVLVGDDSASRRYVALKEKACAEVGIAFTKTVLPETASQDEVVAAVAAFNGRADIDAVLVQLPLPAGIDEHAVIRAMDPSKDVDGFHPENIQLLLAGTPRIMPVIIKGIVRLIESTGQPLADKQAALFANSATFAEPLARVLENRGLRVTTLIGTARADIAPAVAAADVVIVAVGQPAFVRAQDCKKSAIIIDVGTNTLPGGGYAGDVDATGADARAGWITPVPGGVGPMTVAMLTENVLALAKAR